MAQGKTVLPAPETVGQAIVAEAHAPLFDETRRAREAQRAWVQVPVRERLTPVRAFRRLLAGSAQRICQTIADDVGKPSDECLLSEILPLAEECRFLETCAQRILRPRWAPLRSRPFLLWGQRDVTLRTPRGVVAVIGTWNLPLMIGGMQVLHALVAGNAVLFKPSEIAPRTGELLAELIEQSGFPKGLFHLLPARRDAGPQVAEADIDHVVFTGSTATGRALAATLARRLVTSTLELSGCDLLLLLEDGDVALAARGAWFGATANLGQACVGTRRAFVPRSKLDPFLEALTPMVECASPVPLMLPAQIDTAQQLIDEALTRGARLIRREGPPAASGHAQPAALVQSSPNTRACREAFFAPLLTVVPYDRLEQVLAWNAECPFGLGASIFTADSRRALALSGELRCGVVYVNDVIKPMAHPATPFGGQGSSGWGRTKGIEGLLDMTTPQVVSLASGRFRPHFDGSGSHWFFEPAALEGLIAMRHAGSLRGKLRGAARFFGQRFGRRDRGTSA